MTNQRSFVAVATTMLMLSRIGAATAEESPAIEPEAAPVRAERNHSVSLGVGTLAGATSLTYEHRWSRDRGLVVELHGLYLPLNENGRTGVRTGVGGIIGLVLQASGVTDPINDANVGLGAALGHRWHWRNGQRAGFHGLHAGFDMAHSYNYSESSAVEHQMFYVVGNIGQQWRMGNHFQLTARLGAGFALRLEGNEYERKYAFSVRPQDELVDGFPITLDAELSLGYRF